MKTKINNDENKIDLNAELELDVPLITMARVIVVSGTFLK